VRANSAAASPASCRPSWSAHCQVLLEKIIAKTDSIPTRKASQNTIEDVAPSCPSWSADRPI